MKKQIQQVALFHRTYGQPIVKAPALPSKERMLLRVALLQEELDELKEAIENEDLVEIADALIDLDYIQKGSLLEFGLADCAEELFDEVQRSNMSKLDENGNVIRRADGKILKSNLYSAPDLKTIIERAVFRYGIQKSVEKNFPTPQEVYTDLETPTSGQGIRVEQIVNFEKEVMKIMKANLPQATTWTFDKNGNSN